MSANRIFRGLMSAVLAAALFLSAVLPVFAAAVQEEILPTGATVPETTEELPVVAEETTCLVTVPQTELPETAVSAETTQALETTAPPETTIPPETTAPVQTVPQITVPPQTQPPETVPVTQAPVPPEETLPPETTAPEETVPETTVQEATIPETTVPETTVPETLPETTVPETTVPETTIPETTVPETTEPETTLPEQTEQTLPQQVQIFSISQAQAMAPGTEKITIQGTVVYAAGTMAVLQDKTGGIRLSFAADPGTVPGEILLVTGNRTGGIAVEDFEVTGTGKLPVKKATLANAPEALRVRITGARVEDGMLIQGGTSLLLCADSAKAAAFDGEGLVDVWGVILDGCFYADAMTESAAEKEEEPPAAADWNIYFGQLHAHSTLSGASETPEDLFAYAAGLKDMDFFAITDHSDSFDNADAGVLNDENVPSEKWSAGKIAAKHATGSNFTAIYGFEMSWPKLRVPGHITTLNTKGWQAYTQAHMDTLEDYYAALDTQSLSVSQFNHPGHDYGEFYSFTKYDPAYDNVMHLLELDTKSEKPLKYYNMALQQGWHLAPAINGGDTAKKIGSGRTAVLSFSRKDTDLFEAMQNYRVYATMDSDLQLTYQLNDSIMGTTIGASNALTASVLLYDPTDPGEYTVQVIGRNGRAVKTVTMLSGQTPKTFKIAPGEPYYYLQILRNGKFLAATAPVWVDTYEDVGIRDLTVTEKNPMEDEEIYLSMNLYNREVVPMEVSHITCTANGTLVYENRTPFTVVGQDEETLNFPITWPDPGPVKLQIKVTVTIAGIQRVLPRELNLLYQAKAAEPSGIAEARSGVVGRAYRVRGYVTAGNDNPYTTFPDTLYLQDDSGGIAVVGYWEKTLQIGTPLEVTGILWEEAGNRVLKLTGYATLSGNYYRHDPDISSMEDASDYDDHGGELMKIQGKVVSLTKTPDGKGVSRMTLRDSQGKLATVLVENNIRSGAYGTNELGDRVKKGRTVRAMGLVHKDEYGTTVLRARNCDEIVYVPAKLDLSNPQTGDPFRFLRWFFRSA